MPTKFLAIGYTTKARENVGELVKAPAVPKSTKDADIPARQAELAAEAMADARHYVHTGELSRVVIIDPQLAQTLDTIAPGDAFADESPALVARKWLLTNYKSAWSTDPFARTDVNGAPPVSFYGFDVKRFLKMLGFDCARAGKPLPATLWYSNSDHRDMESAVLPSPGCCSKDYPLALALKSLGVPGWNEWQGPGVAADRDAIMSLEIASVLGLLADVKWRSPVEAKKAGKKKS